MTQLVVTPGLHQLPGSQRNLDFAPAVVVSDAIPLRGTLVFGCPYGYRCSQLLTTSDQQLADIRSHRISLPRTRGGLFLRHSFNSAVGPAIVSYVWQREETGDFYLYRIIFTSTCRAEVSRNASQALSIQIYEGITSKDPR